MTGELNRQLSNPVTSLWSLTFQFNNYLRDVESPTRRTVVLRQRAIDPRGARYAINGGTWAGRRLLSVPLKAGAGCRDRGGNEDSDEGSVKRLERSAGSDHRFGQFVQ
jgi:hypothetical protein